MKTKYVIISPVRNEEEFLEGTMDSVVNQTIKPAEFILVNDGSTDRTPEIIDRYMAKYEWIKRVDVKDRGYYLPGTGVVNTFYKGFETISVKDWEFVVKLDCDLEFEHDYFENILTEFDKNPKLGLASGCTYIPIGDEFVREKTQEDHPVGPSKVYKRECFDQIGGIPAIPGWDLADLLASQMKGWETRCFFDLKIKHFRVTGSRRKGITGGKFLLGRFQYRFGYSFFYSLLKGIYRMFEKPVIIGGISIISGYIYAAIRREEHLFKPEMRAFLRSKQRKYLRSKLGLKG